MSKPATTTTHARRGDINRALRRAGLPLGVERKVPYQRGVREIAEHGLVATQVGESVAVSHTAWCQPTPEAIATVRDAMRAIEDAGYRVVATNYYRLTFGSPADGWDANYALALDNLQRWGLTEDDLHRGFYDYWADLPVRLTVTLREEA